MKLREIRADDLDELFEVRVATWHNDRGAEEMAAMGISHDSTLALLGRSHRGWLCEAGGKVVGFAIGNRESGEMWVIAVLREFEGRGIGKALLGRVEEWLEAEGWDEVWLTTDTDETMRAVGFYRHLGWEDWKIEDGDRFMKKRNGGRR